MAWKIIWTALALNQKDRILKYWVWHNKSNTYSKKLELLFHQSAKVISQNPLIGRKTSTPFVRAKLIRNYIIFYKVSDKRIEILMIWDGRRNPKDNPFKDQIK